MRTVDTNVLLRLITGDDAHQVAAAEAFVEPGAWVPLLAVAEAIWVLESVYQRTTAEQVSGLNLLLNHDALVLQDADVVAAALKLFQQRPALGFSDCLMLELARKAGHLPFGTFDRTLAKLDGAQRI